jgi:hypothetical protein
MPDRDPYHGAVEIKRSKKASDVLRTQSVFCLIKQILLCLNGA